MKAAATTLVDWNNTERDVDLASTWVLLADDNRSARLLIQSALNAYGMRNIAHAVDGVEALKMLASRPFDLLLADMTMPEMDGLALTRLIRRGEQCACPEIPIIMVSGHTEVHRVIEARDAGIHEFVAKPIAPATLFRRIYSTLRNPRPFIRTATYIGPDRRAKAGQSRNVILPPHLAPGLIDMDRRQMAGG